jgi:hypothetical protein
VNENLFARGLIRDGHDPVTTTTILTHDSIDKASVYPALRIYHTSILASDHRREDSVEAVLSISISSAKHFFFLCGDESILQESFYLSNLVKISTNSLPNNVSTV